MMQAKIFSTTIMQYQLHFHDKDGKSEYNKKLGNTTVVLLCQRTWRQRESMKWHDTTGSVDRSIDYDKSFNFRLE